MDALQKIADAYEDYRKKQQRNNLLKMLGVLGLGAAGIYGFGKFRSAQIKKIMEQAARKRKVMAGLLGLGVGVPAAAYGLSQMGGDDSHPIISQLRGVIGGGLGRTAGSGVADLFDRSPDAPSNPVLDALNKIPGVSNIRGMLPSAESFRIGNLLSRAQPSTPETTQAGNAREYLTNFLGRGGQSTPLSEMPPDIRDFFSKLGI